MEWRNAPLTSVTLFVVIICVQCFPFNNTSEQGCSDHSDCASGVICEDLKCIDPCKDVCGLNTICVVNDLRPVCYCKPGYEGHPFTECKPGASLECTQNAQCPEDKACMNNKCVDPCQDSCGINSICRVVNHRHVCACSNGFFYNPQAGCQPISIPQCQTSSHCPEHLVCHRQSCVDPCAGVCGNNTICNVKNHHPACACKRGYSGDAFVGCELQCTVEIIKKEKPAKRFIIINEKVPWFEALRGCHSRGMHLATVTNKNDWEEIENAFRSEYEPDFLWLGAHDFGEYQNFIWLRTGRRLSFDNWRAGEPNGNTYHCLASDETYQWMSRLCDGKHYFVCENN